MLSERTIFIVLLRSPSEEFNDLGSFYPETTITSLQITWELSFKIGLEFFFLTRMHSSRMRTGRLLTICLSLLPGGGEIPPKKGNQNLKKSKKNQKKNFLKKNQKKIWGGVGSWGVWSMGGLVWGCLSRGASGLGGVSAPRQGGSAPGGVYSLGVSAARGVSGPGGVCCWGGGVASHQALRQTPPPLWTESQTPVKTLPWPNFVAAGKNCIDELRYFASGIIQSV